MGVMNYEMDLRPADHAPARGCVPGWLPVIVNRTQQEIPNAETMKQTESHAVKIVVEAARRLL
jgi:uridine phosphorylase